LEYNTSHTIQDNADENGDNRLLEMA
jgi:hypothetical protein